MSRPIQIPLDGYVHMYLNCLNGNQGPGGVCQHKFIEILSYSMYVAITSEKNLNVTISDQMSGIEAVDCSRRLIGFIKDNAYDAYYKESSHDNGKG